jgi:hypothetical protein
MIYAYDTRTQMHEPIFIAYNDDHAPVILRALFGEDTDTSFVYLSKRAIHSNSFEPGYQPLSYRKKK